MTEHQSVTVSPQALVDTYDQGREDERATRCPSCEHTWQFHQPNGCWFTVVNGRQDAVLNCACALPRRPHPGPTIRNTFACGCVVDGGMKPVTSCGKHRLDGEE